MRSVLTALQEGRLFELPEAGKDRALEFLARILDANPDIEVGTDAIEEVKTREQEFNTGIGVGVAVPHVRARREAGELFCAIGWSAKGIDYGAEDGQPVRLVFMYYIPGAQKNVYLKEVSNLVKAIRRSGGIDPIAHAPDLNDVRNLLLDWVGVSLGEAGPEAVARMIKLEVKHAQTGVAPAPMLAAVAPTGGPTTASLQSPLAGLSQIPGSSHPKAIKLSILVPSTQGTLVLSHDPDLAAALEGEANLPERLAGGTPITAVNRQILVLGVSVYPGGRTLYECVAVLANP